MERQLWRAVYDVVVELGKTHAFARKQFSDAWIALTHLWGVLHDRPRCWACDAANWPADEQWHLLPSPTTLGRRLRTVPVLTLMAQAQQRLRDLFPDGALKIIDGKPLPVGGYSQDRDATYGRAAGHNAVGYKVHCLRDARCPALPDQWEVAGLRTSEPAVAARLLGARATFLAGLAGAAVRWSMLFGYLVADNNYDTNALYELAMGLLGLQLVAPPKASAAGLGHHRHSPHRLRGLTLCRGWRGRIRRRRRGGGGGGSSAKQAEKSKRDEDAAVARRHPLDPLGRAGVPVTFGQALLRERGGIERTFGLWGNWGGGLGPLPNWVRRPRRVALWVAGKMIFNGARYALKAGLLSPQNKGLTA